MKKGRCTDALHRVASQPRRALTHRDHEWQLQCRSPNHRGPESYACAPSLSLTRSQFSFCPCPDLTRLAARRRLSGQRDAIEVTSDEAPAAARCYVLGCGMRKSISHDSPLLPEKPDGTVRTPAG